MMLVSARTLRHAVLPVYGHVRRLSRIVRRLPAAARRAVPELGRDVAGWTRGRARGGVFVVASPALTEQRALQPVLIRSIQAAAAAEIPVGLLVLDYDPQVDAHLCTLREKNTLPAGVAVHRFWQNAVVGSGWSAPTTVAGTVAGTRVEHHNASGASIWRDEMDRSGQLVRMVDLHPVTGREVTHRYLTGDRACWLSVWVDPERETLGRTYQHLPRTQAFSSLPAAQANWVRQVISSTSRPVLIAGDRPGWEVIRQVGRVGSAKHAFTGEITPAAWRALI
jgi:hypothetical protein